MLVLSVHPEYWTRKMYQRVKRWVFEEGGQLVYLGGNGLNCEVELRNDDTMVVHNGSIRSLWPPGIGAESGTYNCVRVPYHSKGGSLFLNAGSGLCHFR